MAVTVNSMADSRLMRSPKFSNPMANPPSTTVKFSHDRNVRSLAKNTLGSTRTGSAIRLPAGSSNGCEDMLISSKEEEKKSKEWETFDSLLIYYSFVTLCALIWNMAAEWSDVDLLQGDSDGLSRIYYCSSSISCHVFEYIISLPCVDIYTGLQIRLVFYAYIPLFAILSVVARSQFDLLFYASVNARMSILL